MFLPKLQVLILVVATRFDILFASEYTLQSGFKQGEPNFHSISPYEVTQADERNKTINACRRENCIHGLCNNKTRGHSVCACYKGVRGDRCDIVTSCESREMDCGDDPSISCEYRFGHGAYCKCPNDKQRFDYDAKVCKDCDCGANAMGCNITKGLKVCDCGDKRYAPQDGKCIACDCGGAYDYSTDVNCKFVKDKKICDCTGYFNVKQNGSRCEKCYCGEDSTNCEFVEGEKICTCISGYSQLGDECRENCNETNPCQHGGICEGACICKDGTYGPFCENIKYCDYNRCREGSKCVYDMEMNTGRCVCNDPTLIVDMYHDGKCRECDCGSKGNCKLVNGQKRCLCEDKYSDNNGKCDICECGYGATDCSFIGGNKKCICNSGYIQVDGRCEVCECGYGAADCSFIGGNKTCICNAGYIQVDGRCEACVCGTYENCSFEGVTKMCECIQGYIEIDGKCEEKCKSNGECDKGRKCLNNVCKCEEGYYFFNVTERCEDIDECFMLNACPPGMQCVNLQGTYDCTHPDGYYVSSDPMKHEHKETQIWMVSCISILALLACCVSFLLYSFIKYRRNRRGSEADAMLNNSAEVLIT